MQLTTDVPSYGKEWLLATSSSPFAKEMPLVHGLRPVPYTAMRPATGRRTSIAGRNREGGQRALACPSFQNDYVAPLFRFL